MLSDAEVFFLCFMAWLGALAGLTAANRMEPSPEHVQVIIERR